MYICIMKFFIYISVEPYIKQWLEHNFLNNEQTGIAFPRGTAERDILAVFLDRQPENSIPAKRKEGQIAIELPYDKNRSPETYNYLPPTAEQTLKKCIYMRFRMEVWKELHQFKHCDRLISDIILAWMEKQGIEDTEQNWETIRQMYFRQRKKYEEKRAANQTVKSSKLKS